MQRGKREYADILIVRGKWVVTPEQTIRDGALAIKGDTISEIGTWKELKDRFPEATVIGSEEHAVVPGFVNSHHHSNAITTIQQGIRDRPLEPWLLSLRQIRDVDPTVRTLIAGARLLRSGVTSVVDVHEGGGVATEFKSEVESRLQGYADIGIRAAVAAGITERNHLVVGDDGEFLATLPEELRKQAEALLPGPEAIRTDEYFSIMSSAHEQFKQHPRVELWFGPPGLHWSREETLGRMAEIAKSHDMRIQTHLEESLYEKLYGSRYCGTSVVERLHELGMLGPRFSAAHGVWLSDAEIDLLSGTRSAISCNSSSNLRLHAGIAPLNELLGAGVPVGLGLDGLTINDNEDMWQEVRLAMCLRRTPGIDGQAPDIEDMFELATLGGARIFGDVPELSHHGGRGILAVGCRADVVLLRLDEIAEPWVAPNTEPLRILLHRASARDVDYVIVGGALVVDEGRVTTIDEPEVQRELISQLSATSDSAKAESAVQTLILHIEDYYRRWEKPRFSARTAYNSRI